jgi:bacillithiol biosynthesis deacetylase BshB1
LDVLVVAPHPDDAELSMAGTILRLRDEGLSVGVLDLTTGEPTPHGSLEIRSRETAAATEILALDWRHNLGLPNRSLEPSLEARRKVAGIFRQQRPRWVFAPYWVDAHPDHLAALELIEAARFWAKLTKSDIPGEPHYPPRVLHYYCMHLRAVVEPAFVMDITPYWERKHQAVACYHSQFVQGREAQRPSFLERVRDVAAYWGWMIGTEYGEPFASREPLGMRGLGNLV